MTGTRNVETGHLILEAKSFQEKLEEEKEVQLPAGFEPVSLELVLKTKTRNARLRITLKGTVSGKVGNKNFVVHEPFIELIFLLPVRAKTDSRIHQFLSIDRSVFVCLNIFIFRPAFHPWMALMTITQTTQTLFVSFCTNSYIWCK